MSDQWRVQQLDIENFRGVRERVSFQLGQGMNLLVGSNGAGKTSVCHAMEWALFGKVPLFAGGEFSEEDAIANRLDLSSRSSLVRLVIERDGETAVITRTRPRGTSSTKGVSAVTVEAGGLPYERKAAEAWIADALALQAGEFASGVYLRQDTIAELISGDETVRSSAIDKLLGLGQARELIQNLQMSALEREINGLEKQETTRRESVAEAAAMRQVQLDKRREVLLGRGIPDSAISIDGAAELLNRVTAQLAGAAEIYNVISPAPEGHDFDATGLVAVHKALLASCQQIDAAAVREDAELRARASRLADLSASLVRLKQAVGEIETTDLAALQRELAELEQRKQAVTDELAESRQLRDSTVPLIEQLQPALTRANELRAIVNQARAGNLETAKEALTSQTVSAKALLEQQSALGRLLAAAQEQLTAHPSSKCPVCGQAIDAHQTLTRVEESMLQGGGISGRLTQQLAQLEAQAQDVDAGLQALKQAEVALAVIEQNIVDGTDQLRRYGFAVEQADSKVLADLQSRLRARVVQTSESVSELDAQRAHLKSRIAGIQATRVELDGTLIELKRVLGLKDVPADIGETISATLTSVAGRRSAAEDRRSVVQVARTALAGVGDLLLYLQEIEDATRLARDVAPVSRLLAQLKAAHTRLTEVRTTVLDVYNAIMVAQQQLLSGNLVEVIPNAQRYFMELGAHPEYKSLLIEAESDTRSGTNVYRIRATTQAGEDTYVRTIFSRAELNAVALALFLTVADTSNSRLAISILDDPSQSLDHTRIGALGNVLQGAARFRQVIVATEDAALADALTDESSARFRLAHIQGKGTRLQDEPPTGEAERVPESQAGGV